MLALLCENCTFVHLSLAVIHLQVAISFCAKFKKWPMQTLEVLVLLNNLAKLSPAFKLFFCYPWFTLYRLFNCASKIGCHQFCSKRFHLCQIQKRYVQALEVSAFQRLSRRLYKISCAMFVGWQNCCQLY